MGGSRQGLNKAESTSLPEDIPRMALNIQSLCFFMVAVNGFAKEQPHRQSQNFAYSTAKNVKEQPHQQLHQHSQQPHEQSQQSHEQSQTFVESFESFSSSSEDKNGGVHTSSEEVDCIGDECKERDCIDGDCKEQTNGQSEWGARGTHPVEHETQHEKHSETELVQTSTSEMSIPTAALSVVGLTLLAGSGTLALGVVLRFHVALTGHREPLLSDQ